MNISDKGIALIKSFEGLELKAYPDPGTGGDPWTIGYGHTGPEVRSGQSITEPEAEQLLRGDVSKFELGVKLALNNAPTTQGEFDALVSFAFNVGLRNLQKSTLLRKHLAGDKAGAANEFYRWNRAAGRVMTGLTRRRAAEAAMYRGE